MKQILWAGHSLIGLYREGRVGQSPAEQLSDILDRLEGDLRKIGLSLENAVRHRIWTRTRDARDSSNDTRARLITGDRRCATSSFIDTRRIVSAADVAVELLAQRPAPENRRRLVDFDPPRRYAHYLVQDDLVFVSGMAESGATLDEQFGNALGEVKRAMDVEHIAWGDVLSASLFIERGYDGPAWLMDRFRRAVPADLPHVTCEEVGGLASTDKHLEIEITAKRAGT